MLIRRVVPLIVAALLVAVTAFAADSSELQITSSKPGSKVDVDRVITDDKVVVSVVDSGGSPIFGLGAGDFKVEQSGRTANIISAQPLAESVDVPRNMILVLDNSYSMKERRAINSLLSGVKELLKIVRPIDHVHIVVFENFKKEKFGNYNLSVQSFESSKPEELLAFAGKAYSDNVITGKTVLKDAMLAGIELIKGMPESEPRFMVVFSDGEDLNSVINDETVLILARKLKGFSAYAIDFKPGPGMNSFLSEFTTQTHGQIWKAKTENDLVPIFQEVASKMLYFYVVNYLFPPSGSLVAAPDVLKFDEISISGGAPRTSMDTSRLTLRPVVDTAYGIASWKVAVRNTAGDVTELAGIGSPASELEVPLPSSDIQGLASGGDMSVKMELKDKKGQSLTLDAPPVKVELARTSADMTVSPATVSFDEIRISDGAPLTMLDEPTLTLRPTVVSPHGIASWKAAVTNGKGTVAELKGEGAPASEIAVQLPATDPKALAAGGDMSVKMELQDKKGQSLVVTPAPVKVEVMKTSAKMSVAPSVVKFDEVRISNGQPETTMDVSAITVRPEVDSPHGISGWKAVVANSRGSVAELSGEGAPASELKLQLPASDVQSLASGGDLSVKMELKDNKGHSLDMAAPPVKVELVKTWTGLDITPSAVTIEEIRTIDASPMLNHVYFEKGSSDIPTRYVRLWGSADTEGFDEQKFRDALEKYYQVLNIVGKRLVVNPEATVTLVGCNDNTGKEKGNKKLSTKRAEAVRDYLQTVWNIAPERMTIEARNLPAMPSTSRITEGQEENRRVEIRSDTPAILAPIQSTYITNRIDTQALKLRPDIVAPHGIADWKVTANNTNGVLDEMSGEGMPAEEMSIPLDKRDLASLAVGGDIAVRMQLRDSKGQAMTVVPSPVKVNFIQTSQRLAQKEGLRVQEKYALILFDFDKSTIDSRNQEIVNRIVARAKALPEATVAIVGHTDSIGKESYNIKLSERRALAVYDLLKAAYDEDPGERVSHMGEGPNNPLYDNHSPEARSFNRTVTITLEYMANE